jgi:hypothetical protein
MLTDLYISVVSACAMHSFRKVARTVVMGLVVLASAPF